MIHSHAPDVAAVQRIASIPAILATVAHITGLRYTCIARVTPESWTACAVLDQLGTGLRPNDSLDINSTLCGQVRATGQALVIDAVSDDPDVRDHPAPALHGFDSFISVPIRRQNGEYFGTLSGNDPLPRNLSGTAALASMTLFAELISQQLTSQQVLEETQVELLDARATAELREQFIAVLGHDLRNPLGTIIAGADLMLLSLGNEERLTILAKLVIGSGKRMAALVDDVVDLTRGKMGGGIPLHLEPEDKLCATLAQVVDELRSTHPTREIRLETCDLGTVLCDAARLGQLCSNLLKNALVYGDQNKPVGVAASIVDDVLELAVTNHGPGMSADTMAHLFKPYWRAATKSPHEGLGLGLFIVGEIARSHGGEMTVSSSEDLTTFLFRMPCKRSAA
ncbi:MAG: GAF domain-containing sensor histidine kinase [Pseudomonadota bacterium]